MTEKYFEGTVVYNSQLIDGVYDMELVVPFDMPVPDAGQFVGVYVGDGGLLLPRPISVCEARPGIGTIRLVYKKVGKGTERLSRLQTRGKVNLLGPLGNGYAPSEDAEFHIIVGGGLGVPPLLELTKRLRFCKKRVAVVLGFADEVFLVDEFKRYADEIFIATDSGREGTRGNVTDVLNSPELLTIIGASAPVKAAMYSCGPKPMLKAVSEFAKAKGLPLQVSMEERMACGIGSCLCCAVPKGQARDSGEPGASRERTGELGKVYLRVCKDGPVFDYREVLL